MVHNPEHHLGGLAVVERHAEGLSCGRGRGSVHGLKQGGAVHTRRKLPLLRDIAGVACDHAASRDRHDRAPRVLNDVLRLL